MTVLAKSHMTLSEQHAVLKAEHEELQVDNATLKKEHATLKKGMKKEHATLKEEHATLKEQHVKLAMKHSELEKNYTTEKESYSAKVRSVTLVIQSLPLSPENRHLAQICTILADPSYVKMGNAVDLVLSDSNKKCSHHFIYTHQPRSELKFRLEWKRVVRFSFAGSFASPKLAYEFELYSTTDLSAKACGLNLSVVVTINSASTAEIELASICCGRPQGMLLDTPGRLSGQLIGLHCEELSSELTTLSVKYKGHQRLQCGCPCHGQLGVRSWIGRVHQLYHK